MKKVISLYMAIICILLSFVGCSANDNSSSINENTNKNTIETQERVVLTLENIKQYLDVSVTLTNVDSSSSKGYITNSYKFSGDLNVNIKPLSSSYIFDSKAINLDVKIGASTEHHAVTVRIDENGYATYSSHIEENNIVPMTSYNVYDEIVSVE